MLGGCSVMKQSNRPRQLHNPSSSSKIDWSKYEKKNYLHFDEPIEIQHIKDRLQNPEWVASYAFLPSIHFTIVFNKYVSISNTITNEKYKEKKQKKRQIYYAAHKDRFIYKYYGDLLNNAYNEYATDNGIDDIALAYRNNKCGKNNVDFSYEVFDFILNQNNVLVISIDFTSFFDNINHRILKQNIKTVLDTQELPLDWFKVYKSLTQFTYVHRSSVDAYLFANYGVKRLKKELQRRQLRTIMSPQHYRAFKKDNLYKNKKPYGIPQGSGMSAVCSNVHLIHFDKEIKQWAEKYNALYRRYCDDLILVIPLSEIDDGVVSTLKNEVLQKIKKYEEQGLKIQDEKTEIRIYTDGSIVDEENNKSALDYLGFVIDGQVVRLREKSLFKYYSRAFRKAKTSRRISFATKRKGPRRELYQIYSHLGFNYKGRGNFISYANKAHKKMSRLGLKSHIRKQVKGHWNKIHKRI